MSASLKDYLEIRKKTEAEREAFLLSLKNYLAVSQRPHAGDLDEPRWADPARLFKSSAWVLNPTRGYLVLTEDPVSRQFRLGIEQPGNHLVIELSVALPQSATPQPFVEVIAAVQGLELGQPQLWESTQACATGQVRRHCRWSLIVPDLYTQDRAFEHAHYQVWRIFDAAVIHLQPVTTP